MGEGNISSLCLERFSLVSEEVFDSAYEELSPARRGIIKKAIALTHKVMGLKFSPITSSFKTIAGLDDGRRFVEERTLHPSLSLVLSRGVSSPSQLISLLLPPRLAGIKEVRVFRCGNGAGDWPAPLVVSLEMLGIDRVFHISLQELEEVFPLLQEEGGAVCFLCEDKDKGRFAQFQQGENVFFFFSPKRAGIFSEDRDKFDLDEISFSHPSLRIKVVEDEDHMEDLDVLYMDLRRDGLAPSLKIKKVPLLLSPGWECVWMWRDLFYPVLFNTRIFMG